MDFLDAVLAAEDGPFLRRLRASFAETLENHWTDWSEFTKILVVCHIREWNWQKAPSTKSLLIDVFCNARSPALIDYALRLVRLFEFGKGLLILRVLTARYPCLPELKNTRGSLLRSIAQLTCQSEIQLASSQAASEKEALIELWRQVEYLPQADREGFAQATLWQFEMSLQHIRPISSSHAQMVVTRVGWACSVFSANPQAGGREPFQAVCEVIGSIVTCRWAAPDIAYLSGQLFQIIQTLVREGGFGTVHDLQYEILAWLGFKEGRIRGGHGAKRATSPLRIDDKQLLEILVALVDKVGGWKRAEVHTNDLAYGRVLNGRSTVEIIEAFVDLATDRMAFLEDLKPIVDRFIDYGFADPGIALRARLFGQ